MVSPKSSRVLYMTASHGHLGVVTKQQKGRNPAEGRNIHMDKLTPLSTERRSTGC